MQNPPPPANAQQPVQPGAYPQQQPGQPGAYPQQQPGQPGAYPPQQPGHPGAYPPQQPGQTGAYPPQQYPPQQQQQPGQPGAYPPQQQPGYPPQQAPGAYPPQGYPPQQQQTGYPPAQAYPPQYPAAPGYPPVQPGYAYPAPPAGVAYAQPMYVAQPGVVGYHGKMKHGKFKHGKHKHGKHMRYAQPGYVVPGGVVYAQPHYHHQKRYKHKGGFSRFFNTHEFLAARQLKFGLLPYGDCSLVDGERFAVLPLGPSFEHGFPTNTHRTALPPVLARQHLLNLMVSWTVEKPTRVQAMIAALAVCDSQRQQTQTHATCVVEHNDVAFKALQRVDAVAGTNLRWLLSSAPNAYVETLKQSVFTLCPHGKNPEQYRIWEALAAGSIPIVEEFPQTSVPGTFYHPSYPTTWKCVPEDLHGGLRALHAPVLFVRDWQRDLPRLVDTYVKRSGDSHELLKLQRRVRQWYLHLGHHVHATVVGASLRHFEAETE